MQSHNKRFLGEEGRKFLLPLREFIAYTEIQLRPHTCKMEKISHD